MTWTSRLKLAAAAVVIAVVIVAAFVVTTQRSGSAQSTSATIAARQYTVGTDYSGTILRSFVAVGDTVTKGEKLFTVQSLSVVQGGKSVPLPYSANGYSVDTSGVMTFRALVGGTVSAVPQKDGSFVQAGSGLATIDRSDSLYVTAQFALSPRDYERVAQGSSVSITLPNQTAVSGRVKSLSVETTNDTAMTTVTVSSAYLVPGSANGLVIPGTPVTTSVHLRQDGVLAGPQDSLRAFVQKIGL